MGTIVCKFGGTSTADADSMRQIRRILEADGDRRYAVLSAPGATGDAPKVTDVLYRCYDTRRRELIDAAAERYEAIALGLGVECDVDAIVSELLRAAALSRDALASRGEYLCARLFSRYSGMPMVDAARLIRFQPDGSLDSQGTQARIRRMAAETPRAVIPGFYGSDPAGRIVTFPRNGSDITGALVAAGVGAALYENWTDVPGLMTADPAVDPGASVIPEIGYRDMRRMAENGARVLHPDCLAPVADAGIPTRIRCTPRPDEPGTLIH